MRSKSLEQPVFFLAGTMQGVGDGFSIRSQAYRSRLAAIIRTHFPGAKVFCPYEVLFRPLTKTTKSLLAHLEGAGQVRCVTNDELPPAAKVLVGAFRTGIEHAAKADVLIAYLPNKRPSMGTAMEMWGAAANGKIVIAITQLTRHLAVVSSASAIVTSVKEFDKLLASGWLKRALAAKNSTPLD